MGEISINYDLTIDIAVGQSRNTKHWKNKPFAWSDLVKRVATTHRTAETQAEYFAAKKTRQDEIKDIGGFVGGYLRGGRRKKDTVQHRQLLTLDIDFGTMDFWNDFIMLNDYAAVIYSTHKHSKDKPRFRLIIPLDREVMSDESEAIGRAVAGKLDIEVFDPTTFQPERLMYWPSTSKDAEYFFEYQDGPPLCADAVLNGYVDWKDTSAWPVSERVGKILQRNMLKQGDPLEKPGAIGAFCRTYTIHEAIEAFLSDCYDSTADENRYTYKEGSTAAGLIVYDDKYAFSHHGTDPTSGKLCNAFDLVRLHKFGLKDEDVDDRTPIHKRPSFIAAQEFILKDPTTKKFILQERINSAQYDFADINQSSDEQTCNAETDEKKESVSDEWLKYLEIDAKGKPLSSIDNIYTVLKNDYRLQGAFYYDEFEARLVVAKNLPWQKISGRSKDFGDMDFDCLSHYLESYHKMPFTHLQKAISKISADYYVHPVRNYLKALHWDGRNRLETLFIDYLGSEDSDYVRAATRKTFIAAVARIFKPGIKFDTVLTLVGKQGTGKSTIIRMMAGSWFSDNLGKIHEKEGSENLRGVWLMEIAEMAAFTKSHQEAIKRFITSTEDMYRPSYGKYNIRFPRQCIFFATTNKDFFLADPTGNRRFLPINTHFTTPTKSIFGAEAKNKKTDLNDEEINQYWAEAKFYFEKGESIDLSAELKEMAETVREKYTERDERTGAIEKYLNTLLPENWQDLNLFERRDYLQGTGFATAENNGEVERKRVCVAEIWCELFTGLQRDMSTQNTKFIHEILSKMKEWRSTPGPKRFKIYGPQRAYDRIKIGGFIVNTKCNTVSKSIKGYSDNVNTVTKK
ncbi:MAG: virulence-associated E family protein [Ferruginibacter sp.]